jgi:hypothetical protein
VERESHLPEGSPVTEEEITRYTTAQCWVLAWHLAREIPAPYQPAIVDFDEHVLVQIGGEDMYLDVTGMHTKAELSGFWELSHRMHPIAYDLTPHIIPDQSHPENERAREVARKLIAYYLK